MSGPIPEPLIFCKYSCDLCGLTRVPVPVVARGETQTLEAWMQQLTLTLARDHRQRSPHCHPQDLKEVMIPFDTTTPHAKVGTGRVQ